MGREELVAMYRPDVERLAAFLPWLTDKTSLDVVQNFTGENGEVSLPFPIYIWRFWKHSEVRFL